MKLFDYIYYRWHRIYAKEDNHPDIYASAMVATYQMFTIINMILFLSVAFDFERPDYKVTIIPLALILIAINWYRYERDFDVSKLDDRWGNEPENKKRLHMVLMMAYLVITFVTPWVYGFSTN